MRTYRTFVLLWLCLLVQTVLGAQGYSSPDVGRFHYSSAYFITLQNVDGESINHSYTRTANAIGAYVGDELRGVSEVGYADPTGAKVVFFVRVWGDDNDPAVVTFRIHDARYGVEYALESRIFGRGQDVTYGEPSNPLTMTLVPISGIKLPTDNFTVVQGGTTSARPTYMPTGHSQLLSELRTEYLSSNESVFTVGDDGIITGVSRGTAWLTVNVYLGQTLCYSAQASVSVLDDKVAVTGIRNDMDSLDIVKREGDRFQLAFTVLPENATNRMVTYKLGDYSILNIIQEDEFSPATFVAVKAGKTTITVKTAEGDFSLTYNVTVEENPDLVVHVKAVTVDPTEITTYVGEPIAFSYNVLPANATDKSVTVAIADEKVVQSDGDGGYKAVGVGSTTITVTSNDNADANASLTVTVRQVPAVTLSFAANEVVLSKLHDTTLTLKASEPDKVLPNRVELLFDNHPNAGWGAVATAAKSDATGLLWNARASYVGNYKVSIRYNGQVQASTCTIHIPAEYPFDAGWDWLSFHTVSADQSYAIALNKELKDRLTVGPDNGVIEIRSQNGVLYYDPKEGFFGDIEAFDPTEGTYKLKSVYDDDDDDDEDVSDDLSAYADRMYLSTAYTNMVNSSTLNLPIMEQGFVWVTYPHELDHSLAALSPYLSQSAYDEDKIIAKNGFAEFDGEEWLATEGFAFKAGKGYLYYSPEGGKPINWGPATLRPDAAAARSSAGAVPLVWQSNANRYPDCMAVVARIDGIDHPQDYQIGAFVGDECRGAGRCAANGLMYVAVSGKTGEPVTFRLYHQPTGTYADAQAEQTLRLRGSAGSHRQPLVLKSSTQGICEQPVVAGRMQLSWQGNRLVVTGASGTPRVTVTDALGKTVARHAGATLSLPHLLPGVYVVSATDGTERIVLKVKK